MARWALAIVWLALAPAVTHAAETGPRVIYEAPLISVEARNVDLPVLLSEVGRQVGFQVVWAEMPRQPISVDIHDATIEEVLRRLLRSEDHVIVYGNRMGSPRVDSVVLRGPHGSAEPTLSTPGREPGRTAVVPPEGVSTPSAAEPPATLTPAPVAVIGRPPAEAVAVGPPPFVDSDPLGIQNLLKNQAFSGLGFAPSASESAPPAGPPADVAEALAQTTRAALQNLKGLMDSLDAATESLRATGAIPPR